MTDDRIYEECGTRFASAFSLLRHMKMQHEEEESDTESCVTNSDTDDTDSNVSMSDASEENAMSDDDEEEEDKTVFNEIIDKACNLHKKELVRLIEKYEDVGLVRKKALRKARAKVLPKVRKSLRKTLLNAILELDRLTTHPVYNSILKKAEKLENDHQYDRREALSTAISKRKHYFNSLIPSDDDDESEDDGDSNENEDEDDDSMSITSDTESNVSR